MKFNFFILCVYLVGIGSVVGLNIFKDPEMSKLTKTMAVVHLLWIIFTLVQLHSSLF